MTKHPIAVDAAPSSVDVRPAMDRRGFLQSVAGVAAAGALAVSGTAALAAGGGSVVTLPASQATMGREGFQASTPAVQSGFRPITLGVPGRLGDAAAGSDAYRLARRLEEAFGDGVRVAVTQTGSGTIDGLATGEIDLMLSTGLGLGTVAPAFKVFAGLSHGVDLAPLEHAAWLIAGGGQSLWDDLAQAHGVVMHLAGWTGPSDGLLLRQSVESIKGIMVSAHGLAGDVARLLGADVVALADVDLEAAFASRQIDAAQSIRMPLTAIAPVVWHPGLMRHGAFVALSLRQSFWNGLDTRQRAVIAGVAAEAFAVSSAEHLTRARMSDVARRYRRDVHQTAMHAIDGWQAVQRASIAALDAVAATSPTAQRIVDSHRAWRELMNGTTPVAMV